MSTFASAILLLNNSEYVYNNLVNRRESTECNCCQGFFLYCRVIEKRGRKIGEKTNFPDATNAREIKRMNESIRLTTGVY